MDEIHDLELIKEKKRKKHQVERLRELKSKMSEYGEWFTDESPLWKTQDNNCTLTIMISDGNKVHCFPLSERKFFHIKVLIKELHEVML